MILYADDHMLVADKPPGLLSVPGRGEANQDCLIRRVQVDYPDALIVHRLDMATSGLLVMARGPESHRILSKAFADRHVAKTYVAIVAGEVATDEGEIDLPLIADWPNRPRQMVDHVIGKPSLTRYRVLNRFLARDKGTTRVELQPVTGRSHQLRVHMMSIGHPILGDEFYAPPDMAAAVPRLLLHAETLEIPHPATGERARFHAPAPF